MEGLLTPEGDRSLLLSQFREYLEHDDIRYHAMQAATDTVARVTDGHPEVSGPGRASGEGPGSGVWSPGAQARPPQVPLAFWSNTFTLLSSVSLPRQDGAPSNFYVERVGACLGAGDGGSRGSGRPGGPCTLTASRAACPPTLQSIQTSGRSCT